MTATIHDIADHRKRLPSTVVEQLAESLRQSDWPCKHCGEPWHTHQTERMLTCCEALADAMKAAATARLELQRRLDAAQAVVFEILSRAVDVEEADRLARDAVRALHAGGWVE